VSFDNREKGRGNGEKEEGGKRGEKMEHISNVLSKKRPTFRLKKGKGGKGGILTPRKRYCFNCQTLGERPDLHKKKKRGGGERGSPSRLSIIFPRIFSGVPASAYSATHQLTGKRVERRRGRGNRVTSFMRTVKPDLSERGKKKKKRKEARES